ncbi:hypothetical protein [uncultured Candidatus Kuenenia sp.]|nr:hypothetical protein [uncultured Candidatus Kuenenia sp.]
MKKIKNRLKKLLKEGEKLREDDINAQSIWAQEAKILINALLRQPHINRNFPAYN